MLELELNEKNRRNAEIFFNLLYKDELVNDQRLNTLFDVISEDLSEREIYILSKRYGLDGESPNSVKDLSLEFEVSEERIKEVETTAMKKLLHPARKKIILD